MADLFCIRNLNSTNFNLHFFFPSKHCSPLLVQSNNSRISNGIRRRRRSTHFRVRCNASSQTPASTKLDVISTHEHTDGSLVFRFGDPSEVAKNVEAEKSNILNEKDEDSVVQESEDTVKEAGREARDHVSTTEVNDTDSVVVDSKSYTTVEKENNSVVPMLEDSTEVVEVDSIPSLDMEKEEQVENGLTGEVEISSSEDVPVLGKDSDIDHSTAMLELSEEASDNLVDVVVRVDDVSETDVITEDLDAEINEQTSEDTVQNEKTERDVESETSAISVIPEEDLTSSSNVQVNDDNEAKTSSSGAEAPISYAEKEYIDEEDDSENGVIQSMTSSHLEAESILNEETGVDTLEESKGVEDFQSTPVSEELKETQETEEALMLVDSLPQNLSVGSEPNLIEETGVDTLEGTKGVESIQSTPVIEEFKETQENEEGLMLVDSLPQNLIVGSDITEEDDGVLTNDPGQELGDKVAEPEIEPSESFIDSQEIASPSLVLSSGAAVLPHPSKVLTGGEDAYFIAGQRWLGVADGASQWSFQGTNPGLYALELMENCQRLVSDSTADGPINSPVELLNRAVAELQCPGSSTVIIARLDGQALHVANVGNSGFIVIRNGSIHVRSSPMLHAFHFPLQIEEGSDISHLAENYQMDLEEGDVLVASTDGLLDNLFDHEISSIIANSLDEDDKTPQDIAEMLSRKAQEIGMSESAQSPFADKAQTFGFADYKGGKLDDVAVIVSFVQKH